MKDDPSLHDEQLENEIRLVGDLVLAASQSEGPLSEEAIDQVLGLDPPVAVGRGRHVGRHVGRRPARGERAAAPGYPASGTGP